MGQFYIGGVFKYQVTMIEEGQWQLNRFKKTNWHEPLYDGSKEITITAQKVSLNCTLLHFSTNIWDV